jgi:hypothetical protein
MTEALTEIKEVEPEQAATETAETTAPETTTTEVAKPEGTTEAKTESSVPDNWRDLLTGGNEDIAKLINRYGTPANVGKALLEKERIIRQGAAKVERPTDIADEKAMAEYRKAAGLPPDPTGYKLPETVTKALTDEDKPVLAQFTEYAHKRGMTPEAVADAAAWYVESKVAAEEQQMQANAAAAEKCEDAIRAEWSPAEFKGNLALAQRYIEDQYGLPYKEFANARLVDGRRIGDIPEFVMKLSERGRETYGDAVFANSDVASKHENRIKEIEKIRDTDFDKYEKEYAKEYRELLEKELKRKK